MNDDRWTEDYWRCIERSLDELASPDELLDFEEMLQNNPEARRQYMHEMQLQSELHLLMHSRRNIGAVLSQVNASPTVPAVTVPTASVAMPDASRIPPDASQQPILPSLRQIFFRGTGAMSRAAAALLIGSICATALLATAVTMAVMKTTAHAQPVVLPTYVAQLTAAHNLRWDNEAVSPMVDQLLAEGQRLKITSGWAEITFKSGARAVLEGPARLELQSIEGVKLDAGKMALERNSRSAKFTIDVPTAQIVDIGAEFGVCVDEGGAATIEVFDGAVDVHPLAGASQVEAAERLAAGQVMRAERDASMSSTKTVLHRLPGSSERFVRTLRSKAVTLGSRCIGRTERDMATGTVCFVRDPTTVSGRAASFSFYNVHADNDRWITPIILARDPSAGTYRITGIGQPVLNLGSGVQTVPFQPVAGSGDLQAGVHTFGFYHGTVDKTGKATSASLGPLDFDPLPQSDGSVADHDGEAHWLFVPWDATPVQLRLDLEFNLEPRPIQVTISPDKQSPRERIYSGHLEIMVQPQFPTLRAATPSASL
jgi:hypothetical protein